MARFKLIGRNYTLPDLVAKVTGAARYAEDFRADGMLSCRLLTSPMPHARVRQLDVGEALRLPGVAAVITADDLPAPAQPGGGPPGGGARQGQSAPAVDEHGEPIPVGGTMKPEVALTKEPVYAGEPIAAVAAVDEATAVEAIERIRLVLDPLPFVIDPLDSLRPGGPNARVEGNMLGAGNAILELKWTEADFAEAAEGRLPMGRVPESETWAYGDLDAGFKDAALVLDESLVVPTTSHMPIEPRSSLAYWQNGKLFLHCSTQSLVPGVVSVARALNIEPSQIVLINPYAGGGFGSKLNLNPYVTIPAVLARKTGRPVMLRVTRRDEQHIGRTRPGMLGRAKVGFAKDGRITALDLFLVSSGGPYSRGDHGGAARLVSTIYQPAAMRFRGLGILTNYVPSGAQRAPGMQMAPIMETIVTKAARQLGIDQVAIRRLNAPAGQATAGPPQQDGRRPRLTSAFLKEALDKGAELFGWEDRKRRSGQRQGTKVRGIGVGLGAYSAGSIGFDGLLTIQPDGRLYIHSGCSHLGTNSVFDATRAAAEALDMPWEKVVLVHGDTSRHLPWSSSQGGSQTAHAHTRANWAAGLDARRKLQEIAAHDLGGRPDDYDVARQRVFRRGNPDRGLSLARAAERALALGGRYDGHALPGDINELTKAAAAALAGRGLMGVAKDTFPRSGTTMSFCAGFAEVEVDVETGEVRVLDYTAVADCGTVLHPRNLQGQVYGGSLMGMGHALGYQWVYDKHWGLAPGDRFYHHKPPTIVDAPAFRFAALDIPDPQTPVGVRGIGEPPVGAAYGAIVNALADAVGLDAFRRLPITPDAVLTALESGGRRPQGPLAFTL
jgi:CO/xanthine dehydrogenase Mo-binding subunit